MNVGGSSKLAWVNVLALDSSLEKCRSNLFSKISNTEAVAGSEEILDPEDKKLGGCLQVKGFGEATRPVLDKALQGTLKSVCSDAPERFSPYVLAMIRDRKVLPSFDPPKYPEALRKVKNKRVKSSNFEDQDATWVASHLCHNKRCVNSNHLVWEPSWMNRLRDNCPGGKSCLHLPDRCLRPHRPAEEAVDWTSYLSDADAAMFWAERMEPSELEDFADC